MSDTYTLAGTVVDRVGFGAMQLPGPHVMGPPRDHDEAIAVLRRAVELGVNHIDTAQFYGPDVANALIREALHPYGSELALVSKVGARRDEAGSWLPAQTPEQLLADARENLTALATEQLCAINLRLLGEAEGIPADQVVDLDEQLAVMTRLRDEGSIAGIGVSNASLEQVRRAHEAVGLVCVQNPFSYVDQSDSETLDYCTEHDIAYVPFFPLGSAFPGNPKVAEDARVREAAKKHAVTPAQIGLTWLLRRAPNVLLIPGTSSPAHLEENVAVGGLELPAGDLLG